MLPDLSNYRSSILALVAANLVPLFGVLFLGWDAFAIVALYWAENLIIGGINILKMITCRPDPAELKSSFLARAKDAAQAEQLEAMLEQHTGTAKGAHVASQLFLIPFFAFHYGMFCMIHGAFVFIMFGRDGFFSPLDIPTEFFRAAVDEHWIWALVVLAGSHLFSFFTNYLGRGEYRRTAAPILMIQPYARIVVLHIAILFGGMLTMMFDSPAVLLVLLVIGKTVLDLKFHLRERRRLAPEASGGLPDQILAEH